MTAAATLAEAFAEHDAGRLDAAERIYRKILASDPANADALHHLGLIAAASGRHDEADRLMARSLELQPRHADWLFNHGRLAGMRGDLPRARALFERAADAEPGNVDALIALGSVLLQLRDAKAARPWLEKAARLAPARPDLLTTRGLVEQETGSAVEAELLCRGAVDRAPDWANAHNNLGYVLRRQGRYAEAEAACARALSLQPEHVDALVNIGLVRQSLKQPEQAIATFERALRVRPDSIDARYGLGTSLVAAGRVGEGRPVLEQLAAEHPRNWNVRWANLLALPIVYESDAEIADERRRFSDELARLERDVEAHLATDAAAMAAAVNLGTPFHIHYTGGDVRDLQERYGRLIGRIAAAAYPEFALPLRRPPMAGRRLRVGFASSFLNHHSMTKTHGCWISDLPRDRFDVVVFQLSGPSDWRTEELKAGTRWIDASMLDQKALIARIAGESLDAMIWPDIGMDPQVQVPAALRLAPVQAVGIGHPVTTGFATMDAFLSSDAMEGLEGDRHYTEPLVRLPNLSVAYPWPRDAVGETPAEMRRLKSDGRLVMFCAQSLFKLIPQQDDVFARILEGVPDATLVLISHGAAAVTDAVRKRLVARLQARGLTEDRIVFLPRLAQGDFLAANRDADLVLDSFGWSGFNSTMEALAMGAPVVTCPGETVRARHAYGVLKMAGLDELIAGNSDEYVGLAVRLGRDADLRQRVRQRVQERHERPFGDGTAVAAFADWIERMVTYKMPPA
ncbi:MAG TPA: tetratricopeptide repeat protein [Alphaproteobacteria bacterium]|nr:tetratricopeptide repeat protein [Alphaproteobacteria bacterium]